MIEVKDVSKHYKRGETVITVLKNINLTITKGEFVSIMGPSGSGKSTLLYLMGGLDPVSGGKIKINGKDMTKLNDELESSMRRKEIGFIFQSYNLIENLTVEDNILLPVRLDGKKRKDIHNKLDKIIKAVGLEERRYHTPRELSGGQQQRTAIARALINDPCVLFADEPIGNLDSKTGKDILKLLQSINRERKITIVMVTHNLEATTYGSRIIHLKDGMICENYNSVNENT